MSRTDSCARKRVRIHIRAVAHRFSLILSDDQYKVLDEEADRSSVAIAELIRRAIDTLYMPDPTRKVREIIHTIGRRPGRRIVDPPYYEYYSPSQ